MSLAENHRKIIHVDMDAFFASVEQRDNPDLKGKPVAVGGNSGRGVIAAASYEARKYGVRSAMPSGLARRKCPHLIFVKHRFSVYKEVSQQIRSIFYDYTDLVEPLSLDEAFLDVTFNKKGYKSAIYIAREIRARIQEETDLTASAGVSINKFIAKVASDINKPDGLTVIMPDEVESFIEELPIEKFFGVGKATAQKMGRLGIKTGKDLKSQNQVDLIKWFGKFGVYLYKISRGEDYREVKPHRLRKSYSSEHTYNENLLNRDQLEEKLNTLSEQVSRGLQKVNLKGKTLTLKFRYGDFTTYTRSKTLSHYFNDLTTISGLSLELSTHILELEKGIRLLGVGLSNLNNQNSSTQLTIDF